MNPIELKWDKFPFDVELNSLSFMAKSQIGYAQSCGITVPFDFAYVEFVVDSTQLTRDAKLQALSVVVESVHAAFEVAVKPVS